MTDHRTKITGVVLAGGQARRMGGVDKGLIEFNGRPLVAYAIDALKHITDEIMINANRNHSDYKQFDYPVISDQSATFEGPLAGILSAMKAAKTPTVLLLPCDCPLIDGRYLDRFWLTMQSEQAECCVAFDGKRIHPVFLLLECRLMQSLELYLAGGQRKIDFWLNQHRLARVDYSDHAEMFENINSPNELAKLESVKRK